MNNETDSEITELLEMLYNTITDARPVPLAKEKCMISREGTLNLLDDIRAQLPIELAEAKRLVAARDEFIANAKREADAIRKASEERAIHLVEEQEITRIAKAHCTEIVNSAENKSRELMRVANEYVDDALRRTEEAVTAALNEVHNSRARFRSMAGSRPAPQVQNVTPDEIETSPED
ncbi:MAG: hypothetical protein RR147_02435 [Oscillospiraceae bacterium]